MSCRGTDQQLTAFLRENLAVEPEGVWMSSYIDIVSVRRTNHTCYWLLLQGLIRSHPIMFSVGVHGSALEMQMFRLPPSSLTELGLLGS